MERSLRETPSRHPGALAWSADNLLAVGVERGVCVVSASDLGGHAGFVTLTDDAYSTRADAEGASDEPDVDAAFPDDIVEPRRRPRLLLNRAFLRRANRPEVAPRRLAWSHPGAHDVRGGGCLLAVVSNTHRVTIHAPPIVETESEWRTIADLTNLARAPVASATTTTTRPALRAGARGTRSNPPRPSRASLTPRRWRHNSHAPRPSRRFRPR